MLGGRRNEVELASSDEMAKHGYMTADRNGSSPVNFALSYRSLMYMAVPRSKRHLSTVDVVEDGEPSARPVSGAGVRPSAQL